MKAIRGVLIAIAVFQLLSTLLGFVVLLARPDWFAFMLDGTAFEGQTAVPAFILLFVVGGAQAAATAGHWRSRPWVPLLHAIAGCIMIGWIAVECLILDSFMWAHALWGGLGVIQLLLVLLMLGVTKPLETNEHWTRGPGTAAAAADPAARAEAATPAQAPSRSGARR